MRQPPVSSSSLSSSSISRYRVITISPAGWGMRACTVPNPPSPMITSGCAARNACSRSTWSNSSGTGLSGTRDSHGRPPLTGNRPGCPRDLARLVPVDGEQHSTEHDAVVPVELVPDRRDKVLASPGRILLTPGRDGGPRPGQLRRVVFPEPHRRLLASRTNGRIQFTGSGLSCDSDTWEHKCMPGNTGLAPGSARPREGTRLDRDRWRDTARMAQVTRM